jgi:eukaryotic-like serine/threonine-protein kinase
MVILSRIRRPLSSWLTLYVTLDGRFRWGRATERPTGAACRDSGARESFRAARAVPAAPAIIWSASVGAVIIASPVGPSERLRSALAPHYRILSEIGRGGMAAVYLAEDLKHDRQVAVKVLRPELAATLGPDRFLREIRIAATLAHPHILPLHDSGEADSFLYYVMPYVEGETLRDRLSRQRQLPVDEAVRIAREVSDALDYAHRLGVVHRDIKPENILFLGGHAVIADFGVASAVGRSGGERLTESGLSLGTPVYMSPEQAVGQEVDGRSDLYSVGCLLYEMLVGEPPFLSSNPQTMLARKLSEPPPGLSHLRDTVSPGLEHVVRRALAKVPADRFDSAAELTRALAQPRPQDTVVSAAPRPARTRIPWYAALAVALALAG